MLHDNAQLARVYLHAWRVTGNEFFRISLSGITGPKATMNGHYPVDLGP